MILTVIQPSYFPNLETLSRLLIADVAVWANSFLYTKHSTIHRTRIKTTNGVRWLTIPVTTKHRKYPAIVDVKIAPTQSWKAKHLKSLDLNYRNSPYYEYWEKDIQQLLMKDWIELDLLLYETTRFALECLRIKPRIIPGSQLAVVPTRSERVLTWLEQCNCNTYLVQKKDLELINHQMIEKQGARLLVHTFEHPIYHQLFDGFEKNLSALDLLFNEGGTAKSILASSIRKEDHVEFQTR